ncbi:MAG: hypothetical protein A2Z20_11375 [Bdellovibrionales bacterium RBG_16_40_8]|nr:MAG: hypothetical protein A2Z20_11375 [Bdellovibrionales bacterium RBG_16_40_8]
MKIATLYDCFERHLLNLSIDNETEEGFVSTIVENYLVNMGGHGYHFTSHAEDTFRELCDEVIEMLRKKTYGHISIDQYRCELRSRAAS